MEKSLPGPSHWSDRKKYELVQAYVVMGNLRLAAATHNVPEITARKWKASTWWKEIESEIRNTSKLQLSGKLTDIVKKSLLALEDRIENGDWMANPRTGKVERRQITAAVANTILKDAIEKSVMLEKAGLEEKITDEGLDARLSKLRDELLAAANKVALPRNIIEVEAEEINAVESELRP